MTLTVGSLFSGIGGLDLGLERAGMKVIWQSEIDPYACKVLSKHWPEVVNHGNIKEIDWDEVKRPDVICGGYPCQPFSTAGRRRGEEDPRHLWPWVREAISRLRPRYAILENVRGHLSLGGLSVVGELASIGYDAEWRVVSAASVGANHRRDRVIIVAYPNGNGAPNGGQCSPVQSEGGSRGNDGGGGDLHPGQITVRGSGENPSNVANTNNAGSGTPECRMVFGENENAETLEIGGSGTLDGVGRCSTNVADTTSEGLQRPIRPVYEGNRDGLTYRGWEWWQTEPDVGRVANGVPFRVDRLKGLGNAVVPQVAEVIGRLVMAHANADTPDE